jgi:acetyltransferase-like isoleucine patch superfamily enzyme
VGKDLLVRGPFHIRSGGQIHIGDSCIIDSSKERPIRLDVGNQAILKIGNGVYFNEGVHIVCNISVTIGAVA